MGKLFELGGVEEEETGTEAVDSRAMLTVGGVGNRDIVKNSKASAGSFELGLDDLEEIRDLQTFKVECTGCRRRGNRGESSRGLSGGNARGE